MKINMVLVMVVIAFISIGAAVTYKILSRYDSHATPVRVTQTEDSSEPEVFKEENSYLDDALKDLDKRLMRQKQDELDLKLIKDCKADLMKQRNLTDKWDELTVKDVCIKTLVRRGLIGPKKWGTD